MSGTGGFPTRKDVSMTFARQPLQSLLLAGLLAATGLAATAQTATPTPPPAAAQKAGPHGGPGGWGHGDPAKMQERINKRLGELKTTLKITSAQEPAWSAFAASFQPPAQRPARPDRAAFEKMTTPERIDAMRTMRDARNTRMDQRASATKTFYATLSAEQKKTFDEASLKMLRGGKLGGHHGHHGDKPRG
jgi:periplasmic protein CpxP/Spy